MKPNHATRRCHHCNRHSWLVAEGKPCPWCAKKTHKYHHQMNHVMGAIAVLAMCVVAYGLARM
jgi:hypothetical protein